MMIMMTTTMMITTTGRQTYLIYLINSNRDCWGMKGFSWMMITLTMMITVAMMITITITVTMTMTMITLTTTMMITRTGRQAADVDGALGDISVTYKRNGLV